MPVLDFSNRSQFSVPSSSNSGSPRKAKASAGGFDMKDVLDFYREAPADIQEKIIVAMAEEQYSYWDYDVSTGIISVTCLNDLRLAPDCEEQCLGILIAVLSGLPKKLVVETSYTRNFSCFGQRFGSTEEETTDPDVKNWIRKIMPNDFCVEFVFNPYVPPSLVLDAMGDNEFMYL